VVTTTITGFHQDAAGDWVAELACGHAQHVRHRPPWQLRPWVASEAGRAAYLSKPIDCPLCDAAASEPSTTPL
jgi:tellurite methyltransferase